MFYSLGFLRSLLFKFLRISLPYGDKVRPTSPIRLVRMQPSIPKTDRRGP